jgi:hypothetical protein
VTDLPKLIASHRISSAAQLLVYLADDGRVSDHDRWRSHALRRWLTFLTTSGHVIVEDSANSHHHHYKLTDKGRAAVARARR